MVKNQTQAIIVMTYFCRLSHCSTWIIITANNLIAIKFDDHNVAQIASLCSAYSTHSQAELIVNHSYEISKFQQCIMPCYTCLIHCKPLLKPTINAQ